MNKRIQVVWDNDEKTILRWDFQGVWTWEDGHEATHLALEMRASIIEYPCVPSILNLERSANVPIGALPHARTAIELMDRRDYVIIANASGFVRSLTEIFRYLNSNFAEKVLLTRTVDEARETIAQRRQDGEAY
jgi:hypothetical protein